MLSNYFCYLSPWLEALSDLYACSTDKGLLAERSGQFLIINTGSSAHQSTTVCSLSNLVFPNSSHFLRLTNMVLFLPPYKPTSVTPFSLSSPVFVCYCIANTMLVNALMVNVALQKWKVQLRPSHFDSWYDFFIRVAFNHIMQESIDCIHFMRRTWYFIFPLRQFK